MILRISNAEVVRDRPQAPRCVLLPTGTYKGLWQTVRIYNFELEPLPTPEHENILVLPEICVCFCQQAPRCATLPTETDKPAAELGYSSLQASGMSCGPEGVLPQVVACL